MKGEPKISGTVRVGPEEVVTVIETKVEHIVNSNKSVGSVSLFAEIGVKHVFSSCVELMKATKELNSSHSL